MKQNPILNLDSYKLSHINMYPEGTQEVYSNFTPRSTKHLSVPDEYKTSDIIWFGGQASIKKIVELFDSDFFNISTNDIDKHLQDFAKTVSTFVGGEYSTNHLKQLWNLGYLPLEIKTIPEGMLVPSGVPVLTIRNTHPEFYWLTNWLETWISNETWQASTSATIAYYYRKIANKWYEKTGANFGFLDFAIHDFSLRGQTSMDSGIKSGAGHLTSFLGSDTVPTIPFINHYYGSQSLIACSVAATEHSVTIAGIMELVDDIEKGKLPELVIEYNSHTN